MYCVIQEDPTHYCAEDPHAVHGVLAVLLVGAAEVEAAIVSGHGAHPGDQHLAQRRVHVEEEGSVE